MKENKETSRDPDAGRRYNSMKNRDLADVLSDFCNGIYEQTPANEAKLEALLKVIIGRLKTLDNAKVAYQKFIPKKKRHYMSSNED